MGKAFEKVHTMTHYYDGPREGIADFEGRPHLYVSEWDDIGDDYASTFVLSPVDDDLFRLAMEDWAIWRRWETAFHEGRTSLETHPALPEDRDRHEVLQPILAEQLVIDPEKSFKAQGDFRAAIDETWSGKGFSPLGVRWKRG